MSSRLVVVADTHVPRRGRELPVALLTSAESADAVLHLGDFTEMSVAERLASLAPLYAVHGNNDNAEVTARFPAECRLTMDGYRLVLLHGHLGGRTALTAAESATEADVVLFGHSHRPYVGRHNGRLLFNPGSPLDRRHSPFRSFGILTLGDTATANLIQLP